MSVWPGREQRDNEKDENGKVGKQVTIGDEQEEGNREERRRIACLVFLVCHQGAR